ncbi:MAG: family 10 glycosylhydrolase, partial [Erysipelotrichaceae bacterium]|nr:family 10 glycosylhydrolase [Erysipelotrichaceae bacterium]
SSVDEIIDNCLKYHINTIYLHASAFTDAYYDSDYYPTQYVQSEIGAELSYDPLEIVIEKAHQNNIFVEAWINPFRSFDEEKMKTVPSSYLVKQWVKEGSRNIVFYKDRYYLNPAYEEVHELILNVISEIAKNYNVDGIHMDDYFYPDHVDESFDKVDYQKNNSNLSLEDWRRNNVNELVKAIDKTLNKIDDDLIFGISPAGNLEYSRDSIFGDVETWVEEGWVDYIAPQIYFGYTNKSKPYAETLSQWNDVVHGTEVQLIVGLGAYKINQVNGNSDDSEWIEDTELLAKQIEDARMTENYAGYALYSYHSMFRAEEDDVQAVMNQLEEIKELIK